MDLSVIIPIYNVENYISDCVGSLLNQDFKDFEVIFVDDGSTDHSITILENMLMNDSSLNYKIIHKNNEGLPQARKTGLNDAKGEYITFLDSDDWIETDYLSKSMAFVNETKLDLYNLGFYEDYGNRILGFSKVDRFQVIDSEEYVEMLHKRILFHTMCSKIIRRRILEELFVFPKGNFVYEDYITLIPALRYIDRIGLIPVIGYHYRIRNNSMGHGAFTEAKKLGFSRIRALYSNVIDWFPSCENSIKSFYSIEYMALVVSMGRNNNYDINVIKYVSKFLKDNFNNLITSDYVDLKFKLSIIPIIFIPKLFSRFYCKIKY